ncbi:Pre-mRNA-splicing factor cwc22 [Colletotrichum sp. SAR 10_70]|nr:Pre-mRNA-splicing factor cwc22 [Colletotrichum sp. SAR 10_71]KAI8180919.1 Pre-mRNA-splicing factor cwc22 [Colletotrichum sp. SAR 10_65]KAI8187758.1 Pre-mRNA-splicing factor cwc22 [Colletotrichum sp. SAR 10_75]KAI8188079.1 Pre-mRNA-splicing factor cwc22 [Colletotrichum sp. SAR 10_70]KAI8210381.1 Pre-mRNA-splicing factor cwc22 [Colletotrichum sp. SAR 10_76]KAI8216643.1 Pre-mRNA-splicing factor cwc22 [Colletotrichum sp. SAR 10_77]KAI8234645.1 Pre-mRNA-splicing factor cwc22 [Colletotrichum sp.
MASADVESPRPERRERDGESADERDISDRRPRHDNDGERPRDRGRDRARPDSYRPAPKERRPSPPAKTEEEKQAIAKAEYEKLLSMRSGGTYIPPARLRALQAQITDKSSKEYQRLMWEALKKSINGLINKVNYSNIKHIVPELFGENLIKGRGLFCRSIMKAQAASLPFTPVFAAMAAIVNTKLPAVGELLVKRLIMSFRKGFKRSDKAVCVSSTTFLAHLINHQVVHERLAGQMLLLLLHKPTDDSVEIAVNFFREVGQHLQDMQPAIAMAVWDQLRNVLHEADIDKRVQYMIEVLFQVRKDNFKDNPPIKEELDLVEEEDQITHMVDLDGEIDVQDSLNIFKFDPQWEEHEEAYKKLKAEILGEGSDYEDDDDEDESSEEEEDEEEKAMEIKDQSNTDLVNLRRTIYLTVMSSIDPEEAVHKLLRVNLPAGQEPELPSMIVEICSQEKTYSKFHGLIGERFAKLNRLWTGLFEDSFVDYYNKIHRYETNRLRNIARFFAHLLATDAIGWHVLSAIHLNEEETTSSSRIFIKILFQDISEEIGMAKLQVRMKDEILQPSFTGLFPRDNARNIRFSINYFTSIGMGALTEASREYLQNMPKPALPAPAAADESDSESIKVKVSETRHRSQKLSVQISFTSRTGPLVQSQLFTISLIQSFGHPSAQGTPRRFVLGQPTQTTRSICQLFTISLPSPKWPQRSHQQIASSEKRTVRILLCKPPASQGRTPRPESQAGHAPGRQAKQLVGEQRAAETGPLRQPFTKPLAQPVPESRVFGGLTIPFTS